MNYRITKFYKNLNSYLAVVYAEGFLEGENATKDQQLAAWQYISDHRLHRGLQGWFGRTVKYLINEGIIQPIKY